MNGGRHWMNLPGLPALWLPLALLGHHVGAAEVYNIAVAEDGRYQLQFEDLGPAAEPVASDKLRLFERWVAVPMQIEDGGDGVFGPGDTLRFTGRRLAGSGSWYDAYTRYNVFQLRLSSGRTTAPPIEPAAAPDGPILAHLERQELRVALKPAAGEPAPDRWYWQRITHLAGDDFKLALDWKAPPERLRIGLMGLSHDRYASDANMPQHEVHIYLDDRRIGEARWDGQAQAVIDIAAPGRPAGGAESALLEVRVPSRMITETRNPVIDAVLLDWIELEYSPETALAATITASDGRGRLKVDSQWLSPERVWPAYSGPRLRSRKRQADYLMISHPSLLSALAPLAEFHRSRGKRVEVVEVQSIYDEFNHGVVSPHAIADFIGHARRFWQPPAPTTVLLVGDASWDRDPYAPDTRNLVPTMQVLVDGQLAASDNGLVTVEGDDWLPDLAVGRLPAGTPQELTGMIDKVLAFAARGEARPKGRRAAWIAGEEPELQKVSTALAELMAARGFQAERIYPGSDSATDQSRVLQALSGDNALVHFLGHGGRFVWRTGPLDLRAAKDLFNADDIAALEPGHALPFVLSMTCSSGPFDHPQADSIAEVFLRTPQQGAIGVLAASWRIPASHRFSGNLALALLTPGKPLGTAVLEAKRLEKRRNLVEAYNLLGDPGISLIPEAEQ
ncbi:MAG: C25 family cysteine peptidase [Pseudomonadota bacterium]